MGLIVHKETERLSKLNDRIAADLRARAVQTAKTSDPDLVEDSDYTKNLRTSGRFSWVWFVLVALAVASLALIILF